MKRIDPSRIAGIVAHRWPPWRPHFSIKPGEWLLSTWYGDAETLWVKVPMDAESCCYHKDVTEAFMFEDGDSEDEWFEREGWICAVAFLGDPIEQRSTLCIDGLDNG